MSEAHQLEQGVSMIGPLEGEAILNAWPKIYPFVETCLAYDDYRVGHKALLEHIEQGNIGLYTFVDFSTGEIIAFICCEILEYETEDVFHMCFCGGKDLYRWAEIGIVRMEEEAFRLGCKAVRITGRPGWSKVYPDYKELHRSIERRVSV